MPGELPTHPELAMPRACKGIRNSKVELNLFFVV